MIVNNDLYIYSQDRNTLLQGPVCSVAVITKNNPTRIRKIQDAIFSEMIQG